MIYVDLNEEHVRRLSFYLAMEEWVARNKKLTPHDKQHFHTKQTIG